MYGTSACIIRQERLFNENASVWMLFLQLCSPSGSYLFILSITAVGKTP
jgi:hypothetical protein